MKLALINIILLGMVISSPVLAQSEEVISDTALQQRIGSANVPGSLIDPAFGAYQRGLYLSAFKLALPRAQSGDPAAQTLIAEIYENGHGLPKNTKEAAVWYEIASKAGNREAQFSFAMKLLAGRDVPKDQERGFELMRKAALAGHPQAMFNHANNIVDRRPTSAGYRKALPFYEKAAEHRIPDAYYALSQIYKSGSANGIQDPKRAKIWLEKAAQKGMAIAQIELAISLLNGDYGERNESRAFALFNQAAQRGNVVAQNRLAKMYAYGVGIELSEVQAAKWHILASRAGRSDFGLDRIVDTYEPDIRDQALKLANDWRLPR